MKIAYEKMQKMLIIPITDSKKKMEAISNPGLNIPERLKQAVDTKKSIVKIREPYVVKCLLYQPGTIKEFVDRCVA